MATIEQSEKIKMSNGAFDLVFRKARTYNAWLPKPVPDDLLQQLYETLKWGPTSGKYESCEVRIHSFQGCKGTPPPIARSRERREDDERSGHGHRRL